MTTKKILKKTNSHLVVSALVNIAAGFDSSCLDSLLVEGFGISDFALLIFVVSAVVVLYVLIFVETVILTEAKQASGVSYIQTMPPVSTIMLQSELHLFTLISLMYLHS